MSELPDSALARCLVCGGRVEPSPRVLIEVIGYMRARSSGAVGSNHIRQWKPTGREVCADCATRVEHGLVGQEALL